MRTKYIIFNVGGLELPVLFPEAIPHLAFKSMGDPVSAGFCSIEEVPNGRSFVCSGESLGLKLKSRPGDAALMNMTLAPLLF